MEDQMPDIVLEISDDNKALESTNVTPSLQSEHVRMEGSIEATDASQYSNDSQATSVDEEPKLPSLKKINDLIDKFQTLEKDHTILSNEVKDVTSQFSGTLQHFSEEHELLKKKFMEESELLKKKYSEEYAERKRLYNEVIELKGNIRVFCRCRPLNQEEIANGSTSVIEILPSQDQELSVICADSSKKQFKFDHVFGPHVEQEEVFAQTAPIVTSVLDGYNVCIFAYGQTGTGKTFTMEGTPENRGVNYRTLEELFKIANHRNGTMRYELFVSMLEVYNEKIRDLLVENTNEPHKKLEVKQAPEGTLEIPGLVEAPVYRTEEVWELLKTGSRVRSVGSTNANEFSSRSHCLLRVTVKGKNLLNGHRTKSNLWLVDLAGSERVGRIDVEGERLKESQFINKSLSALGDVISALATKTAHVPYRNSKLTHMLQSSLGGDCKTLMFVQISPSSADLGETLCSLNFASRVKGIEYGPARRQADFSELLKYKHMVEKLKHDEKETKKLQETVQSLQLRLSAREFNCRTLQEKVKDLENQLAEERKNRKKQDSRAVATTSSRQPIQEQKKLTEKRPPLGPSNTRIPLRVSNLAQPTSIQAKKIPNMSSGFTSYEGKENNQNEQYRRGSIRGPRRVSIAVRPSSEKAAPQLQPKRRISIATWRPESSLQSTPMSKQTKCESAMPRPSLLRAAWRPEQSLQGTPMSVQAKRESAMPRPSLLRDYSKVRRFSRQFSPMPETPKSSRRFMGSPPTEQVGSWKPKHPTVVALQKKPVVWSPLKLRSLKNFRRSIV